MSIKWYQEHLEEVVRENQTLRFLNQKHQDRQIIDTVTQLFKNWFPELPTLPMSSSQSRNTKEVLKYYKNCGQKWIEMMKSKLSTYQENLELEGEEKSVQKISENVSHLSSIKEKEFCLLCGNPKEGEVYHKLKRKIDKLENTLAQLKKTMEKIEQKEEEYLKEIFALRSTTKQYEYQLQQQILNQQRIKKAHLIKEQELQKDVFRLQKEVQMWREEYDRIWNQQKQIEYNEGNSGFQEERVLLNTLYGQEKELTNSSRSQGHFWITKISTPDHSQAEYKKDDIPSLPSTQRQSTNK